MKGKYIFFNQKIIVLEVWVVMVGWGNLFSIRLRKVSDFEVVIFGFQPTMFWV